jgi:hypothetical protein
MIGGASTNAAEKGGHKNADHQTIPRTEQLVDLGFLTKPIQNESTAARESSRRWWYKPTETCKRWRDARQELSKEDERLRSNDVFLKTGFARTAVFAFHGTRTDKVVVRDARLAASYLWRANERVGRRHGNSPMDSLALYAMTSAAAEGHAIEMASLERLMNIIKSRSVLPEHVYFAGGNDLDTMFVRIKPDFMSALEANVTHIQSEYEANVP